MQETGSSERDKPSRQNDMKAMLLESLGEVNPLHSPLKLVQHPELTLTPGEVLLCVTRCGVCHAELDEIGGRENLCPHLKRRGETSTAGTPIRLWSK